VHLSQYSFSWLYVNSYRYETAVGSNNISIPGERLNRWLSKQVSYLVAERREVLAVAVIHSARIVIPVLYIAYIYSMERHWA